MCLPSFEKREREEINFFIEKKYRAVQTASETEIEKQTGKRGLRRKRERKR